MRVAAPVVLSPERRTVLERMARRPVHHGPEFTATRAIVWVL